ncbi:MAG TPA: bL12 family ribosomal protein [Planctomycetota bacterium]|nr:bL12 family ribosomal protein [Planctomycetota bacterium]
MGNVAGLLEETGKLDDAERAQLLGSILEKEGSLGLARLLDSLEKKLGVDRASAGGGGAPVAEAKKAEGPSAFDVVLKSAGAKKIDVIKIIREVAGLDLMGAKGLADKGGDVKKALPKDEADALGKRFKEAGAEIELKPA